MLTVTAFLHAASSELILRQKIKIGTGTGGGEGKYFFPISFQTPPGRGRRGEPAKRHD